MSSESTISHQGTSVMEVRSTMVSGEVSGMKLKIRASVPLGCCMMMAMAKKEPSVDLIVQPPLAAGIHAFELEGEILEIGTAYQWSVAVVPDPDARSNDIFASALMTRVAPPTATSPSDDPIASAAWMAREGLWYDALATLSEAAAAGSTAARRTRADLLSQVGLTAVARFEQQEMQQ